MTKPLCQTNGHPNQMTIFFQELSTIFPIDQKVPVSFAYVLHFPPICRPMLKQTDLTWNNPSKDDVRYVIEKNILKWSERRDSNPRPLHPQYSELVCFIDAK